MTLLWAKQLHDQGYCYIPTDLSHPEELKIKLSEHPREGGWTEGVGYWRRTVGPYLMTASNSDWQFSLEGEMQSGGWASSLDEAKKKCEESVLLAVLYCLEFY